MKTRFTTIITAVVVIAADAQAADLYVAPAGDDAIPHAVGIGSFNPEPTASAFLRLPHAPSPLALG